MLNKILVFGGMAVSAILIIENMVSTLSAYVLWDASAKAWMLSLVSTIVGIAIGFGLKSMYIESNQTSYNEEEF